MRAVARGRSGLARRHPRHADGRGRSRPPRSGASGPRGTSALGTAARAARRAPPPRPQADGPAPDRLAPASFGSAAKIRAEVAAISATSDEGQGEVARHHACVGPAHALELEHQRADRHAGRERQLLRHAGEARRPAHGLGVDVGIGDRVDAGELQRLEEAADQQHGEDDDVGRAGSEQRDGGEEAGC